MLRLCYVVVISLPFVMYYICKARYIERHEGSFSEERRYKMARKCISIMMRNGRIRTESTGQEYLPEEGGYVMYSNHQGKFDTLGIMISHPKPCTIVIDAGRSTLPITNSFIDLVQGQRLDKTDMKSQLKTILEIAEEVKNGRRYIIFPEGGYERDKKNDLQDFLPGSFKCATRSKAPIVPVAIIDSYKPFGVNSLRKVKTQVHFLAPIFFEEYAQLNTRQIAELVKSRIAEKIEMQLS
ncbi:MAG: 1-acyl-sn-glycerol-3-phosphate acyltransferase [Eubacterium sp.]|nr:1-acyl-sn-glycerol-3-phosphate acyltransferase [Eubacterium sp.]MCM1216287.1 1-acyl-sn-glycerol-3-phosphate acyltransferase [Lachnospiraceae bacterium]MCM1303798.1 1-acyl-sn-glycerol-3-phosphate acyltransferase [Butyrivibrio sp.]MCM1342840.1 1-acyl-sn-glycerol-3-phosphate acyltransferase [Muribaculaceae bacterium]MCM1240054.1 1-acyl-sn-glycerol-3-phosphate acyltransferase [Lachnospiraceae bacterium]